MTTFLTKLSAILILLSWFSCCGSLPSSLHWNGSNLAPHLVTTEQIKEALQLCPHDNEAFIRTDVLAAMLDEQVETISRAANQSAFEQFFYSTKEDPYAAHEAALDALIANDGKPTAAMPRMPCGPVDEVKADCDFAKLVKGCKVVVATAILGKHDILHPPAPSMFADQVCYIAFLDGESEAFLKDKGYQTGDTCEGWQVIRYNKNITGNARLDSRILKILLPRLLPPSVRWSIWLDSKHRMDVDPVRILYIMLWQYNSTWTIPKHGNRISVQDEQDTVVELQLVPRERMLEQRRHHLSKGFGLNTTTGLLDGCLHLRDHGSYLTHLLSCAWWNELVHFPPRDQLSFNYLVYRLGFRSAVTPQQFIAMRPFLKTLNKHTLAFNLMYDMRSTLVNSTIHVAARCDFLSMMPFMHHIKNRDAYAKLMKANVIMSAVAKARASTNADATKSRLLRGSWQGS